MRDADLAPARGLVAQPPGIDGLRFRVRQQRERDAVPLGERRERFRRVVAQRDEPEPFASNQRQVALQLDQLRTAVRSPVGGPEEHEHRALRSGRRSNGSFLAPLIFEREIGDAVADLGTELRDVHRRLGAEGRNEPDSRRKDPQPHQ
jgi:hypothetical protein